MELLIMNPLLNKQMSKNSQEEQQSTNSLLDDVTIITDRQKVMELG